jgi:hypothetical protein
MNSLMLVVTFALFVVHLIFGEYSAAIAWFVALGMSLALAFGNQCTCSRKQNERTFR